MASFEFGLSLTSLSLGRSCYSPVRTRKASRCSKPETWACVTMAQPNVCRATHNQTSYEIVKLCAHGITLSLLLSHHIIEDVRTIECTSRTRFPSLELELYRYFSSIQWIEGQHSKRLTRIKNERQMPQNSILHSLIAGQIGMLKLAISNPLGEKLEFCRWEKDGSASMKGANTEVHENVKILANTPVSAMA